MKTYPDIPIENEVSQTSNSPLLKQLLLNWRYFASKNHKIPKRLLISANEIDNFDEQSYDSIDKLLTRIWFTSCQDPKCLQLSNELEEFLNTSTT
jgi:hypothetical protein